MWWILEREHSYMTSDVFRSFLTYLPKYPHQILYYISLFSKIRWSLTYLPTQKSDVIYECSLNTYIYQKVFSIRFHHKNMCEITVPHVFKFKVVKLRVISQIFLRMGPDWECVYEKLQPNSFEKVFLFKILTNYSTQQ